MKEFLKYLLKNETVKNEIINLLFNEKSNLVPFSTGTDEEIFTMINAYYNKELSLEDIMSVWHIGDEREIILTNNIKIKAVIIGFDHDNIVNPDNKSLITLQVKDTIYEASMIYSFNDECNWEDSGARKWCNILFNYFPLIYKKNIKTVFKYTDNFTEDKCFLLSEKEVFGKTIYSNKQEENHNKQYKYYEEEKNRIKDTIWWLRSPCASVSYRFCFVDGDGDADGIDAFNAYGLAPAFCL